MHVQILNKQNKFRLSAHKAKIAAALELAWKSSAAARSAALKDITPEFSLTFIGPRTMKALNEESRGIAEVTDVLSFPMHEFTEGKAPVTLTAADLYPLSAAVDSAGRKQAVWGIELGDIFICPARAAEQAEAYGHGFERELVFLALHGFLHLLGYDHMDAEEDKRMRRVQTRLLKELGLERKPEREAAEAADKADKELEADGGAERDEAQALLPNSEPSAAAAPLTPPGFRSGFIAVIGRPNAGKSTLINQLSGSYLAITSPKAQTTRSNIRCIIERPDAQCVFIDTPGLHKPQHRLGEYMMQGADAALRDCELILLLMDAQKRYLLPQEIELVQQASAQGKKVILALNKVDQVEKLQLLPLIEKLSKSADFHAIVPISALKGDGSSELLDVIVSCLPLGPRYYSAEDYTDQSERMLAAELIREQVLRFTNQEIPHGTAVIINQFEEIEDEAGERRLVRIKADILCERASHKAILIGEGGQMLKRIGTSARIAIAAMLECKLHLELFVKVRPDWRNRPALLSDLGYQPPKKSKNERPKP